jgi:hypothetical protein
MNSLEDKISRLEERVGKLEESVNALRELPELKVLLSKWIKD